ncbi:MAG: hypothetical protein AB1846_02020 [Chloroflexota bacterium]
MDNFLNFSLLIVLGLASLLAFFAALILLLPGPITKTRLELEANTLRATLLGLVNFIFFGMLVVLSVWLAQLVGGAFAAVFILLGGLILLALAALSLIGVVALAQMLGSRMGKETTPFITILRGGGLLLMAALAPYIGWFLFTPLAFWAGLGAAIKALVQRKGT